MNPSSADSEALTTTPLGRFIGITFFNKIQEYLTLSALPLLVMHRQKVADMRCFALDE